jgi:drug/metabolite transporter (DMT)-like permease
VSIRDIFILLCAGVLAAVSITFYLSALKREEATIVVPLMQMIPVFGYIFGYIILGETLTSLQILASLIIISGAIILSLEFVEEEKIKLKRNVLILMCGCAVFFALYETLFKFVAIEVGFVNSTFWEHFGILLYGFILFISSHRYREDFKQILFKKYKRFEILSINVISEVLTLIGNIVTNFALLLAPLAMVQLVSVYQPVFTFIIGIALTLFFPRISTEKITTKHMLHKTFSIAIILIGSYLIFV